MAELFLERNYWETLGGVFLNPEGVEYYNKNILVVDDDQDFTTYLKKILSEMDDVTVDVANDHTTAWKLLNAKKHDLIIMDIVLPVVSGVELAKSITRWYHRDFPIIFVSGNRARKQELLNEHFFKNHVDFCPKPINKNFFKLLVKRRIMD